MSYLVTFYSNFDAILANRTLLSAGFQVQLMPVPRVVSASCGTCVRFDAEAVPPQLSRMDTEAIYYSGDLGWKKLV